MPHATDHGQSGFTLIEVLVALFIFTLVSMIMTSTLHSLIQTAARSDKNTEQMENLQIAFLLLSRDIEQAINRPSGTSPAFSGTTTDFTLTHMGFANPGGQLSRSTLQQTRYLWRANQLVRMSWPTLDPVSQSLPGSRVLLKEVDQLAFAFLDGKGKFHEKWPPAYEKKSPLPRAVRIVLTLKGRGTFSQLYRIPGEFIEEKK